MKIKQWQIDVLVEAIEEGGTTLENIKDDKLRHKVASQMKANSVPESITITGKIKRESEKAILFRVIEKDVMEVGFEEAWFPKSQVEIYERSLGPCDQIDVPEWLLKAKKTA